MDKKHFGIMVKKEIMARLEGDENLKHYRQMANDIRKKNEELEKQMEADYGFDPVFVDIKQVQKDLSEKDFKNYMTRYQNYAIILSYENMLQLGRQNIIKAVLKEYCFTPDLSAASKMVGQEGYSVLNFNIYGFVEAKLPVKVVDGQVVNLEERAKIATPVVSEIDDEEKDI